MASTPISNTIIGAETPHSETTVRTFTGSLKDEGNITSFWTSSGMLHVSDIQLFEAEVN
ncbi:hypothetical protein QJS04_geneDACA020007 [Acorus gramineus]|uniref:Uncharacterized protein n=1 Tax=Acorus gramineus TaxID=55184 RepID=A0AAV9A776_ACOGR|nr:hypothetical protein QJS04_geneDACA020007 [Acorus gramineus]